ncbi:FadR family transcriptional regulator [Plantibacter sp. PA-3-X8]|uniref:FadR/GntR family transcriptional regulator n=1 Tax=Plantibacter sp. PA-3-X8 TaxID=2480625 RepID=UPI000F5D71BB|nr:FCD domain-containing protein [Plantibacter sp. PA-3-X8]AZH82565.1 FadR family transcriptional regulator [Plantibacter sp. PA-3-X8]
MEHAGSTETRVEDIADALQQRIADEFEFGAKLPSESELSERYGISRATVREVLKILSGRGLIELGRGRRGTVTRPTSQVLGIQLGALVRRDPQRLIELAQIRDFLDEFVAQRAAEQSSPSASHAVDSARSALGRMRDAASGDALGVANGEFHAALIDAAGSEVLSFLLDGIESALVSTQRSAYGGRLVRDESTVDSLAVHEQLFDAVAAGKPDDARTAAREHARLVRAGLRQRVAALLGIR